MKKTLTEKALNSIIKKCINESLILEKRVLVDNFQYWANHIDQFNQSIGGSNGDNVWFIQMMKRKKDNPKWDTSKSPNYHAGAEYGLLKNNTAFLVKTGQELLNIKQQVVNTGAAENARFVIWANPRSESEVNQFLPQHQKRFSTNDPRAINGLELLYGQCKYDAKKFPNRKTAKFDLDCTDKNVQNLAVRIIKSYDPNAQILPSPSGGIHVMINDQYAPYIKDMINDLKIFDSFTNHSGVKVWFPDKGFQQTVHFNPDANFILYSNVDTPGY